MEEGLSVSSTSLYNGLKCYWKRKRKRRGYERLNGSSRRRRFWKINIRPRLRLRLRLRVRGFSPKKLIMNMRDAYVNMMMKMANSRCILNSGFGSGGGGDYGFGMRQSKEYDEKVLVEIYKSMVIAQGQLVPRNVAGAGAGISKFGTQIMCQR